MALVFPLILQYSLQVRLGLLGQLHLLGQEPSQAVVHPRVVVPSLFGKEGGPHLALKIGTASLGALPGEAREEVRVGFGQAGQQRDRVEEVLERVLRARGSPIELEEGRFTPQP